MEMEIATLERHQGPLTEVRLSGRLDAAAADQIGTRFTAAVAASGRPAAVDVTQVDFIASMGLRLLLQTAKALRARGAALVIYGAGDSVREVFANSALDQIIPLEPNRDAALARLSA